MKALIVFESMFGNTQQVAQAIRDGLAGHCEVTMTEVGAAGPLPDDIDLLVVGGPTHAFGMSRATTRQDAARQADGPLVSAGVGIREWIAGLPQRGGPVAVAFDTRMGKPSWLVGSAARSAAAQLKQHGLRAAARPESFHVQAVTGPLAAGELARARNWGDILGKALTPPKASSRT